MYRAWGMKLSVLRTVVQGWFPHDSDLWGPNVLEQSLAAGDMVRPLACWFALFFCAL